MIPMPSSWRAAHDRYVNLVDPTEEEAAAAEEAMPWPVRMGVALSLGWGEASHLLRETLPSPLNRWFTAVDGWVYERRPGRQAKP